MTLGEIENNTETKVNDDKQLVGNTQNTESIVQKSRYRRSLNSTYFEHSTTTCINRNIGISTGVPSTDQSIENKPSIQYSNNPLTKNKHFDNKHQLYNAQKIDTSLDNVFMNKTHNFYGARNRIKFLINEIEAKQIILCKIEGCDESIKKNCFHFFIVLFDVCHMFLKDKITYIELYKYNYILEVTKYGSIIYENMRPSFHNTKYQARLILCNRIDDQITVCISNRELNLENLNDYKDLELKRRAKRWLECFEE